MTPLQDAWDNFVKIVLADVTPEQRDVMYEAYMAGCFAAFTLVCNRPVSEERVHAVMRELAGYRRGVLLEVAEMERRDRAH